MRSVTFSLLLSLHILAMFPSASFADSPAPPVPLFTTSERGDFVFKMVPGKYRFEGEKVITVREPYGVAYSMDQDGNLAEMWKTEGWYAFKVYLSDDGRYLVRMGLWAGDQEGHSDLAVAFYDKGKLLREYRVRDLLKERDVLEYSVSHYMWGAAIQSEPVGFKGLTFKLTMIDKTAYSFAFDTGQVILSKVDPGAKSAHELWREERVPASLTGKEMYQAWGGHEKFDRRFKMSDARAWSGPTRGLWFVGEEWKAVFTPLKEYDYPCRATAVFLIDEHKKLEANITPQKVEEAMGVAVSHPYIVKRFDEEDAESLNLYFSGDRLHWSTSELVQWLEKCGISKPSDEDLNSWACFNISSYDRGYQIVYLNVKTGQLVYEDATKGEEFPKILLDSKGQRQSK